MKEIIDDVTKWIEEGQSAIAVATVLRTWGSAPRRPGAKMAIDSEGHISGSVSGGCVEGAVIENAQEVMATGEARSLHFGVVDETAWSVGLACGGTIDVFVEPLHIPTFEYLCRLINEEQSISVGTIIRGPADSVGQKLIIDSIDVSTHSMPHVLADRVIQAIEATHQTGMVTLDDETAVFVDRIRPAPMLIAVGGGDIAIALTKLAHVLGYRTVVIDPRRVFASDERFPHVDRLIQKWPRAAFATIELSPDTAVALLTHDPKIDDPSLEILLDREVFYIGALGSRKTHAKRLERLAERGFESKQTDRIHAPIGLDIGAANPQEIAVSIIAEVVKVHNGAKGAG